MTIAVLDLVERLGETGSLEVEGWPDPVIDRLGHDPRSAYVERFWLPILGPSTIFLLRHLADGLERSPEGWRMGLAETARALGLGERRGRNAPFARTLARIVDFEMARLTGDRLAVRRFLPPLARRHVARLPESLREAYERQNVRSLDERGQRERPGRREQAQPGLEWASEHRSKVAAMPSRRPPLAFVSPPA